MPSLRSNKNKKGIPTLPVPVASVCIPVNVPDDPRWIALFLGAIYQLSQQIWYDRDAEHSAKIVADKWRDIYLETVKAAWDCSGMFDLRIDPLDECSIQKTNDGETWIEVFRLDTRCAIANIVRNPYTGTLGYWDDLEFYTIPDGPWTPSLYPEFSSNPPPITGTDKECLASATAAYVLRNLYKTVADTLLDEVGATDWDYATNLGLALQGFLMLIGAAAMQVYVSIASLLGIVGVRQQYIDYPLDNDDEELLKCILLEHATEHSSGSVTFDFQGVWDDINLDSPKNGLVRFLLTMIGPDALNYAGAVDAGLTPNCDTCGCAFPNPFAGMYDFSGGNQHSFSASHGTWTGSNWATAAPMPANVSIQRDFGVAGWVETVNVGWASCENNTNVYIALYRDGLLVWDSDIRWFGNNGCVPVNVAFPTGGLCADEIRMSCSSHNVAYAAITYVEILDT